MVENEEARSGPGSVPAEPRGTERERVTAIPLPGLGLLLLPSAPCRLTDHRRSSRQLSSAACVWEGVNLRHGEGANVLRPLVGLALRSIKRIFLLSGAPRKARAACPCPASLAARSGVGQGGVECSGGDGEARGDILLSRFGGPDLDTESFSELPFWLLFFAGQKKKKKQKKKQKRSSSTERSKEDRGEPEGCQDTRHSESEKGASQILFVLAESVYSRFGSEISGRQATRGPSAGERARARARARGRAEG
ncbi:hypothetical protein Mp_1g19220 [Marchantia polymorpha subsp. ruderalis]|nr:hypothetical protein MARPO_0001s0260 [Marchantia polymorpha]BBM99159.1 hypothetical protein Mp_1g19220 [Marchantia polymorpha subsp. ruderalis]|eukprot:PTQ50236.1 hypothetical protein MARPO_0001s0260 [Marchantia polymorpha]